MAEKSITIAHEGDVAIVTVARPEKLNAFNIDMLKALAQACDEVEASNETRVAILTGAGKAFCAGYDLDEAARLPTLGALGMLDLQERAARALGAVRAVPVPVIAAVNGPAAGGGMSLSLMADIRLGSPAAKFNAAFVRIGLSAGDLGASWLLPRLIGPSAAAEIGFTGRMVDAEEAEQLGLLNRLTGPEDLLDQTLAMANQICANSPGGIRLSKRALQANMEVTSFAAALELENRGQALLTRCDDMTEALDAFKAKRVPNFSGR